MFLLQIERTVVSHVSNNAIRKFTSRNIPDVPREASVGALCLFLFPFLLSLHYSEIQHYGSADDTHEFVTLLPRHYSNISVGGALLVSLYLNLRPPLFSSLLYSITDRTLVQGIFTIRSLSSVR